MTVSNANAISIIHFKTASACPLRMIVSAAHPVLIRNQHPACFVMHVQSRFALLQAVCTAHGHCTTACLCVILQGSVGVFCSFLLSKHLSCIVSCVP